MPRYPEKYDNFGISTFKRCAREGHYRIDRALVPQGQNASALLFGAMMHKALDTLYETQSVEEACKTLMEEYQKDEFHDPRRTPIMGAEMLAQYWSYWEKKMEGFETVAIERYFEFPLYGENDIICPVCGELPTDMSSKHDYPCMLATCPGTYVYRVVYCGLIDKIERNKMTGEVIGKDHKTTSYLDGSYLQAMKLSSQFMGYYYWLANYSEWTEDVGNTFLADFLLTAKSSKYSEQPGLPLRRESIHATPEILEEWAEDTRSWVTTIQSWRSNSGYEHGAFEDETLHVDLASLPPKNPDSCSRYRSLCPFYDLCSHPPAMRETHINMLYQIQRWEPENR